MLKICGGLLVGGRFCLVIPLAYFCSKTQGVIQSANDTLNNILETEIANETKIKNLLHQNPEVTGKQLTVFLPCALLAELKCFGFDYCQFHLAVVQVLNIF